MIAFGARSMSQLNTVVRSFFGDSTGATAIEYALIASMISIVIVGSVIAINGNLTGVYDEIRSHISPALAGKSY